MENGDVCVVHMMIIMSSLGKLQLITRKVANLYAMVRIFIKPNEKNERDRRKKNVQLKNENKQNRVDRATTVHTLHTEYASVNRISKCSRFFSQLRFLKFYFSNAKPTCM